MKDNSTAQPKRCPFCGWPATAMMDTGTKVWRVYCNDDGTCGDDAPGCCAEGPEAMTEAEAIAAWNTRAPVSQDAAQLVDALDDLQQAEAEYRLMHDRHGDGSQAAGRAWDLMRRAGDKAREAITRVQPSTGLDMGAQP